MTCRGMVIGGNCRSCKTTCPPSIRFTLQDMSPSARLQRWKFGYFYRFLLGLRSGKLFVCHAFVEMIFDARPIQEFHKETAHLPLCLVLCPEHLVKHSGKERLKENQDHLM